MFVEYNPNPCGRSVGDCAIRAIARALNVTWESAYRMVTRAGLDMCDMPSSDSVWGAVLRQNGFYRKAIPNSYPVFYTAKDFCKDHEYGTYVLGFGGHVATVVNGNLYDSWDSSNEVPQFYWYRERSK